MFGSMRSNTRALMLMCRGESAKTNFPISDYEAELEHLRNADYEMLVADLRSEVNVSLIMQSLEANHFFGMHIVAITLKVECAKWYYLMTLLKETFSSNSLQYLSMPLFMACIVEDICCSLFDVHMSFLAKQGASQALHCYV